MAKDPAFLFYSSDFTIGTQFLTDEQTGKYIRLLVAQHQHGRLSEKHMLQICKTYDFDVFSKFIRDEDGVYYNERLENEVFKRRKYSESRSNNRQAKKTYVPHMENENENINVFNNGMFKKEDCGVLPDIIAGSAKELLQITKQKKVSLDQIHALWPVFLTQNVTGKKYYANIEAVHSHFLNWTKNQSFEEIKPGAEINKANETIRQALKNARNGITAQ